LRGILNGATPRPPSPSCGRVKPRDESKSSFYNGLLVGLGIVFNVQGLISALRALFKENLGEGWQKVVVSYLQLYGGYFPPGVHGVAVFP